MSSAHSQMKQMIDQLMGSVAGKETINGPTHYSSSEVCKCFLLGLCPHDALLGTRMSFGQCSKIHDFALKTDFEADILNQSPDLHRSYRTSVLNYLQKVITQCEYYDQVKKGKLSRCQNLREENLTDRKQESKRYAREILERLEDAENLGNQGRVRESMKCIEEVESLKRRKAKVDKYIERRRAAPPEEPVKPMNPNICPECGMCIGLDDNEQRVSNHSTGRLHHALIEIRAKIAQLRSQLGESSPDLGLSSSASLPPLAVQRGRYINPRYVSTIRGSSASSVSSSSSSTHSYHRRSKRRRRHSSYSSSSSSSSSSASRSSASSPSSSSESRRSSSSLHKQQQRRRRRQRSPPESMTSSRSSSTSSMKSVKSSSSSASSSSSRMSSSSSSSSRSASPVRGHVSRSKKREIRCVRRRSRNTKSRNGRVTSGDAVLAAAAAAVAAAAPQRRSLSSDGDERSFRSRSPSTHRAWSTSSSRAGDDEHMQ